MIDLSMEWLKLESSNFHVDYIISQHKDDKPPLKGRGQCHETHFSISTFAIIYLERL